MPAKHKNDIDIIIFGSGMGVLSAASILAQMKNKRVLVLLPAMMSGAIAYGVIEGIPLNLIKVFSTSMKYSKSINLKE
ncbi:MAG: hypothetical protein E2O46_04855 [Ignavibacteria bacterium]|nr:MAG: hypothetical protein E2O46_04855 [Ignavibacteria bacterium]